MVQSEPLGCYLGLRLEGSLLLNRQQTIFHLTYLHDNLKTFGPV